MTLEQVVAHLIDAAEASEVPFMVVGAFAAGAYGVPRSTRDLDLLVAVQTGGGVGEMIRKLDPLIEFDPQTLFDSLTWGRRHVGHSRASPPFKVELFEVFDDPFVAEQFGRRRRLFIPMLNRHTWLPTPEDVVVQKLRWGRNKDLDDARDVLAVQSPEMLDMDYINRWCEIHGTQERLREALEGIPPL